jgi:nuclear migration protein JNM1
LRREAEELKEELTSRRVQRESLRSGAEPEDGRDSLDDGLLELSRALDDLHASSRGNSVPLSAEVVLSQKLSTGLPGTDLTKEQQTGMPTSPHLSTGPSGLLANAASFDSRLSLLEAALGIANTPMPLSPDDQSESEIHPILPTLNHLSSQLATLSSTLTGPSASISSLSAPSSKIVTTPHLEALTVRIRKLTADADALSSARRRATEAARAVVAARMAVATVDDPGDAPSLSSSVTETDSAANEQAAKIQALYTTLPTITSLHPLLPSVLERLRSLRAIHTSAAHASEDLDALEQRQTEMKREIDQWRGGLRVVEERVREAEATMKGNMEVMGPWVRDLERRLAELEG